MMYTDIVPPQKTKTIQTTNHLKVKTVSVLINPPPISSSHLAVFYISIILHTPKIVEQIVNILPPNYTPYLPNPSRQIQM